MVAALCAWLPSCLNCANRCHARGLHSSEASKYAFAMPAQFLFYVNAPESLLEFVFTALHIESFVMCLIKHTTVAFNQKRHYRVHVAL